MGADSLAENTQLPQNLSAQAQKFWISMKKGFIGRPYSVVEIPSYRRTIGRKLDGLDLRHRLRPVTKNFFGCPCWS
jgi:hypothetical protein